MEQLSTTREQCQQFTWKGKDTWISIDESALRLRHTLDLGSNSMEIPSCHILSASTVEQSSKQKKWSLKVDFIKSNGEKSLKKFSVVLLGQQEDCQSVATHINELVQSLPNRKKSLLVIVNPVSGRKKGLTTYKKILPLFELANIKIELIVSKEKGHATELLKHKDLDTIDGVVLVGGDGTYYEVLNGLLFRAQSDAKYDLDCPGFEWLPSPLPVGIIPCGTGNGIASTLVSLDPVTAALAIIIGKQHVMTTYTVHQSSGKFLTFGGLSLGYGYFSDIIYQAENRRTLGVFRYPVYLLWGLFHLRRFKVDIEYEVPTGDLIVQNKDGDLPVTKGDGDSTVQKGDGDSTVQKQDGPLTEQKGSGDSVSDVGVGHKPENTSEANTTKESVQSEVKAEVTAQNESKSNLEVKTEFLLSESKAEGGKGEPMAVASKTGDDEDVQSKGLPNGPKESVTDGATSVDDSSKEPVVAGATDDDGSKVAIVDATNMDDSSKGAAASVRSESRQGWKYITGTYISLSTFLHYEMNKPKTEVVDVFLCNTIGDMKNIFKRIMGYSKEYPGPMFQTRRLLLEIPNANENIEMEMALNCDGEYIILEAPIYIQICFQVGLINAFCC